MKKYAGVLVRFDNKCLLCKRSTGQPMGGEWSIPAGHLEENESPRDGARREFYEETDKTIGTLKFAGLIKRYNREAKKVKGLMYVYLLEVDQEIQPDLVNAMDGEEHTDWGYFELKDISAEKSGEYMHKIAEIVLQ